MILPAIIDSGPVTGGNGPLSLPNPCKHSTTVLLSYRSLVSSLALHDADDVEGNSRAERYVHLTHMAVEIDGLWYCQWPLCPCT